MSGKAIAQSNRAFPWLSIAVPISGFCYECSARFPVVLATRSLCSLYVKLGYSVPHTRDPLAHHMRQIVLATLRNVELLEGDGTAPYPWPIEMDDHDNAAFLASPSLYDVDGDGVQVV